MMGCSPTGELWLGLVEGLRQLADRGLTTMRTTFDRRWAEFKQDAVHRSLEQRRALLSGLTEHRFEDGTADLMVALQQ